MGEEAQIEIRLLTEDDLAAALRLTELARWNQTERDWRRLLRLEPRGCFAAWLDGRLVATTTTTTYGTELAWIGMVLVDPEFRRRGIATRLMRTAMAYLRGAGLATVKLDATPAGRPVYEALGFVGEGLIERWEAVARPVTTQSLSVRELQARPEMCALDRRAFNADRASLLDALVADSYAAPLAFTAPGGRLQGYALARRGKVACYVGPLVATDEQAALSLLDCLLDQLAGEKVYLDFHTGFGTKSAALRERGFVKQRDLMRMRYGQESRAGASALVFAIAGPEIG